MSLEFTKPYPLDSEMRAFLEQCAAYYPESSTALSVDDNRRLYLTLCEAFNYPIPSDITVTDESVCANGVTIPVRRYTPESWEKQGAQRTRVLYYHGGGFVVGNLESHHSICGELAANSNCELIAVDYRLSPESKHPDAFNDALAAFEKFNTGRTIVAGDSAGGTLAAAVCAATKHRESKPCGQLLIYPWLGGELFSLASYEENKDAPGLTLKGLEDYNRHRTPAKQDIRDHTYYPLALSDFLDMPPCISFAAEFDPLRDDSGEYVSRLQAAGTFAENHIEAGLIHGYLRARRVSDKSRASFTRICAAIRTLAER